METSCGIVLVNFDSVLVLQYPQGHWDLPKGHVEDDDGGYRQTAARELEEETGITEIEWVDGFSTRTEYEYVHRRRKRRKQVMWMLATTEEMEVVLSEEHLNYMWLDWDSATSQLTHDLSRGVITAARSHFEEHQRSVL